MYLLPSLLRTALCCCCCKLRSLLRLQLIVLLLSLVTHCILLLFFRESLALILSTFLAKRISMSQFNRLMVKLHLDHKKMIAFDEFYACFRPPKVNLYISNQLDSPSYSYSILYSSFNCSIDCTHSTTCRLEPNIRPAHHRIPVAWWLERLPSDQKVLRLNPTLARSTS